MLNLKNRLVNCQKTFMRLIPLFQAQSITTTSSIFEFLVFHNGIFDLEVRYVLYFVISQ